MNDDSLKHRVVIGIAWMTTARAVVRILGLISTLVLARLLTPADFGLVAMATAVAGGLELLTLFGFDVALVQRQVLAREHYDSAWTLNLLLATGLALAVAAAAVPAAAYYREPRLEMVLIIVGARYVLQQGANPGIVDFRRNLEFGKDFVMQVGPKLFGISVTIPLAFLLRDYRALIAGMVLTDAATCLLSYAMHPHRPRLCMTESRTLFRFSRWLLLNNFISFVRNRGADFIVGRALGPGALGIYSLSYEVGNLPTTEMVAPINRVLLPGYVKAATDPEELRDSFRATLGLIALVILPASIGLAAVADPLVRMTLGAQWLGTIPLITLLAIAGAGNVLQTNTASVHHALGQPRMITLTGVIQVAILLPLLIYLTYRFGLTGAASAYVISSLGPAPLVTYVIFLRTTPVKFDDLWRPCWRPMVAVPLMFVAVRGFLANVATDNGIGGTLVSLIEASLLGVVLYACVVSLLWILAGRPEGIRDGTPAAASVRCGNDWRGAADKVRCTAALPLAAVSHRSECAAPMREVSQRLSARLNPACCPAFSRGCKGARKFLPACVLEGCPDWLLNPCQMSLLAVPYHSTGLLHKNVTGVTIEAIATSTLRYFCNSYGTMETRRWRRPRPFACPQVAGPAQFPRQADRSLGA